MSYLIVERKIEKQKDDDRYWENQLFIHDRPLYDHIYNPESNESDVISAEEEFLEDPNEIEAVMRKLSGSLSMVDNRIPANNGEWM